MVSKIQSLLFILPLFLFANEAILVNKTKYRQRKIDLENWMLNLPTQLKQKPLTELCIPGSHDSGTSGLDLDLPVANNEDEILQYLGNLFPRVKKIIYNWSVTQKLSIAEQLNNGIRYFDIRTSLRTNTSELRIVHGLYGGEIGPTVMEPVKEFLDSHSGEVILIAFNHFHGFSDETHQYLLGELLRLFNSTLVLHDGSNAGVLTLEKMVASGRRLFISYAAPSGVSVPAQFWPRSYLEGPWAHTNDLDELMQFLNDALTKRGPPPHKKFFITQGVRTEEIKDVVDHLIGGTLEETLARETTEKMVEWLTTDDSLIRNNSNVVRCDFVEKSEFVPTVINVNYKRI